VPIKPTKVNHFGTIEINLQGLGKVETFIQVLKIFIDELILFSYSFWQ